MKESPIAVDIAALVADPGGEGIQPLSFTPLVGGIAIPFLSGEASRSLSQLR